jgi:hypothetical protein
MSDELLREILRNANKENLFRALLVSAREGRVLVEVFADPKNLEASVTGFVRGMGEDTCTFEELDSDGEYDGMTTIRLRDVVEVVEDSYVLRRVAVLHAHAESLYGNACEEVFTDTEDAILGELEAAARAHELASCRLSSGHDYSFVVGFVKRIGEEFLQIARVTRWGEKDGVSTVRLQDISLIYRDDQPLRAARFLYMRENDVAEGD